VVIRKGVPEGTAAYFNYKKRGPSGVKLEKEKKKKGGRKTSLISPQKKKKTKDEEDIREG